MARATSRIIHLRRTVVAGTLAFGAGCVSSTRSRLIDEFHEVGKFRPPNMHELYPSVTHFVVAPDSVMRDRDVVLAYARRTCADGPDDQVCLVLFWTDESRAATGFPITEKQQDAIVASYDRNRSTGKDGFQYYQFR